MSGLFTFSLYMAPSLIALIRQQQGKPIVLSLGGLIALNFLLGWTVVGWFLALACAFGLNPVAWVAIRLAPLLGSLSGAPANVPQGGGSAGPGACGQCGGSGSMMCSSCGGRGSWYDAPQTATGSPQLHQCTYCTSSGRIRCPYCGGSGKAAQSL